MRDSRVGQAIQPVHGTRGGSTGEAKERRRLPPTLLGEPEPGTQLCIIPKTRSGDRKPCSGLVAMSVVCWFVERVGAKFAAQAMPPWYSLAHKTRIIHNQITPTPTPNSHSPLPSPLCSTSSRITHTTMQSTTDDAVEAWLLYLEMGGFPYTSTSMDLTESVYLPDSNTINDMAFTPAPIDAMGAFTSPLNRQNDTYSVRK